MKEARIVVSKIAKDHHAVVIEGNRYIFERSELREFISMLDNSIDVCRIEPVEAISKDDYMDMISKAKAAALSEDDDDCTMCGS